MKTTWRFAFLFVLAPLLARASGGPGQDPPSKGVAEQVKAIGDNYKSKEEELDKKLDKATKEKAIAKLEKALDKLFEDTCAKYLEISRKNAKDPDIFPALEFLLSAGVENAEKAFAIVVDNHVESKPVGKLCLTLVDGAEAAPVSSGPSMEKVERLARAVIEKNRHDEAKGPATLALARIVLQRSENGRDRDALRKEAEALLTSVVEKYPASEFTPWGAEEGRTRKVGDVAKATLFEFRNLATGLAAPEIESEDLAGKEFKLSGLRGKVVLLHFWRFS